MKYKLIIFLLIALLFSCAVVSVQSPRSLKLIDNDKVQIDSLKQE